MREDFAAMILTHGRPERVKTYKALRSAGYTGKIVIVIDDEDPKASEYIERYGRENVVQFSKSEAASHTDSSDNSGDRRAVVFARNACWSIARSLGIRYFMQLDDDYASFMYRYGPDQEYVYVPMKVTGDQFFEALIDYYESIPATSIAIAQGGDYLGGKQDKIRFRRKCMNTWLCSVDRQFRFSGKMNEDVSAYTELGRQGQLFATIMGVMVSAEVTQTASGGMTEAYLQQGTYMKSMMTVIRTPSCVAVGALVDHHADKLNPRAHHMINTDSTYPKILNQSLAKGSREGRPSPLDLLRKYEW